SCPTVLLPPAVGLLTLSGITTARRLSQQLLVAQPQSAATRANHWQSNQASPPGGSREIQSPIPTRPKGVFACRSNLAWSSTRRAKPPLPSRRVILTVTASGIPLLPIGEPNINRTASSARLPSDPSNSPSPEAVLLFRGRKVIASIAAAT
ncbi:hypothetical protein N658DRAFT_453417, partial [Parathielavia hyrcaniae]